MVLIKSDGGAPAPPANEHMDGDYYDRCPVDGGEVVDATYKAGGVDNHGEEYRDWSIYNSNAKEGGCGHTWSRTTSTGRQRDNALGREPAQLTRGAQRTVLPSPASQAYQDNYRRIFGHD